MGGVRATGIVKEESELCPEIVESVMMESGARGEDKQKVVGCSLSVFAPCSALLSLSLRFEAMRGVGVYGLERFVFVGGEQVTRHSIKNFGT